MNIHQQPETYQVALFFHCIGPEALKIFNRMSLDNTQEKEKLQSILKKFDEFTISETSETYKHCVFNSQNQLPNETFDAYLAVLHTHRHDTSVSASENCLSATGLCWEFKTRKQEKDFDKKGSLH